MRHRETVRAVAVERRDIGLRRRARRRHAPPGAPTASATSRAAIEVGASPRGPIGLVQAAQALALLRGRGYVTSRDVRDLAPDVLRHRLVLCYEALADGVTADAILDPRARGRRGPGDAPRRSAA